MAGKTQGPPGSTPCKQVRVLTPLPFIMLACSVFAQDINTADLPGMPAPYVPYKHSDMVTALLAMDPPMQFLCRPSSLTPDGRRMEFYGDYASGLFIATIATLGSSGSILKSSNTIIVGATARDNPVPMTPDPAKQ